MFHLISAIFLCLPLNVHMFCDIMSRRGTAVKMETLNLFWEVVAVSCQMRQLCAF